MTVASRAAAGTIASAVNPLNPSMSPERGRAFRYMGRDRPDDHAASSGRSLDLDVRSAEAKIREEMHPLIGDVDGEAIARAPGELSHQRVALIAIL